MSQHVLESESLQRRSPDHGRRHLHPQETLVLTELDPLAVVDHLDPDSTPLQLTTFGNARETCPKCQQTHLQLVLRQRQVRIAHLFCDACLSCFDAHYHNGEPALTI